MQWNLQSELYSLLFRRPLATDPETGISRYMVLTLRCYLNTAELVRVVCISMAGEEVLVVDVGECDQLSALFTIPSRHAKLAPERIKLVRPSGEVLCHDKEGSLAVFAEKYDGNSL